MADNLLELARSVYQTLVPGKAIIAKRDIVEVLWSTLEKRLGLLESRTAGVGIEKALWTELNAISPTQDGQAGAVIGPDPGTHYDAEEDGSVDNEGRYSYDLANTRWIRIGDYNPVDAGSLGTVATTNDYADLDNLPTLGTAAAVNTDAFAAASVFSTFTESSSADQTEGPWNAYYHTISGGDVLPPVMSYGVTATDAQLGRSLHLRAEDGGSFKQVAKRQLLDFSDGRIYELRLRFRKIIDDALTDRIRIYACLFDKTMSISYQNSPYFFNVSDGIQDLTIYISTDSDYATPGFVINADTYVAMRPMVRFEGSDCEVMLSVFTFKDVTNEIKNKDSLESALSDEAIARDVAISEAIDDLDSALTQDINDLDTSIDNLNTTLGDAITSEATARADADTNLQNNITTVSTGLAAEILTRANQDEKFALADKRSPYNLDFFAHALSDEINSAASAGLPVDDPYLGRAVEVRPEDIPGAGYRVYANRQAWYIKPGRIYKLYFAVRKTVNDGTNDRLDIIIRTMDGSYLAADTFYPRLATDVLVSDGVLEFTPTISTLAGYDYQVSSNAIWLRLGARVYGTGTGYARLGIFDIEDITDVEIAKSALEQNILNESETREQADDLLSQAVTDETTARQLAITNEAAARQLADNNEITAREAAIEGVEETRASEDLRILLADRWSPYFLDYWSHSLVGEIATEISVGTPYVDSEIGKCIRLTAADMAGGDRSITLRNLFSVEEGRVYEIRVTVKKLVNDGSNDRIDIIQRTLDNVFSASSSTMVVDDGTILSSDGAVTYKWKLSTRAGFDVLLGSSALFLRPAVKVYGNSSLDILIGRFVIDDITDAYDRAATNASAVIAEETARLLQADRLSRLEDRRVGIIQELYTHDITAQEMDATPLEGFDVAITPGYADGLLIEGADVPGAGYFDIAKIKMGIVEEGRVYEARAKFDRIVNPSDSEDGIELRIVFLNANGGFQETKSSGITTSFNIVDGVKELKFRFCKNPALGVFVDHEINSNSALYRAVARVHGGSPHETALIWLDVEDVTASALIIAELETFRSSFIDTLTVNPNSGIAGETKNDVEVAWTITGSATVISQTINDIELLTTDRNWTDPDPVTNDKTYVLKVETLAGINTKSTKLNFSHLAYAGASVNATLNEAQILALGDGSIEIDGLENTYSIDAQDNDYVFVAYPAIYGDPNQVIAGILPIQYEQTTVSVTTASGYTGVYNVIRLPDTVQSGTVTVTIQ